MKINHWQRVINLIRYLRRKTKKYKKFKRYLYITKMLLFLFFNINYKNSCLLQILRLATRIQRLLIQKILLHFGRWLNRYIINDVLSFRVSWPLIQVFSTVGFWIPFSRCRGIRPFASRSLDEPTIERGR